jgi:hypothetical protein
MNNNFLLKKVKIKNITSSLFVKATSGPEYYLFIKQITG